MCCESTKRIGFSMIAWVILPVGVSRAVPPAPIDEPVPVRKNRYVSFQIPGAVAAGVPVDFAIRVKLVSLHNPSPANDPCCPAPDFSAFEGQVRWVGAPADYSEFNAASPTFRAAILRCSPHYQDWGAVGPFHVTGPEIIPDSVYEVQAIEFGADTGDELQYSSPLTLATSRHGDIGGTWNGSSWDPPDGAINADDIIIALQKFQNNPAAPTKPRSQNNGQVVEPGVLPAFATIGIIVDAFSGFAYPYPGPCACPSTTTCPTLNLCGRCNPEGAVIATLAPSPPDRTPETALSGESEGDALNRNHQHILRRHYATQPRGTTGPTIALTPISATGPHQIAGDEIVLYEGGTRVTLEIQVYQWDPDMDDSPRLGSFQATIDPSGYLGVNAEPPNGADLAPAVVPCASGSAGHNLCEAELGISDGEIFCGDFPVPANHCPPAVVETDRSDWAFAASSLLFGFIRLSRPEFAFTGIDTPGSGIPDDGSIRYGGSLFLDVPPLASGTYTINLLASSSDTFMNDGNALRIPGVTLLPARITVYPLRPNRFLPMSIGPAAGGSMAIRVKMVTLQDPNPPNPPGSPPQDFSGFEFATCTNDGAGCVRWVTGPFSFPESTTTSEAGTFFGATLSCTPVFRSDWATFGDFYVSAREIVPSSVYEVEYFDDGLLSLGPAFTVATGRWGDVIAPYKPPDSSTQPDFVDISAVVDKFKSLPTAIPKARAQLQPDAPDMNADISFLDISGCVDAFKGLAFPYSGPLSCPP